MKHSRIYIVHELYQQDFVINLQQTLYLSVNTFTVALDKTGLCQMTISIKQQFKRLTLCTHYKRTFFKKKENLSLFSSLRTFVQ